jgi:O-Antigen ligase
VHRASRSLRQSRRLPNSLLERQAAQGQTANPNQWESLTLSRNSNDMGDYRLRRHVTATAAILFLLILSGPPRMRIRDPEASLRGDVDWVVVIHLLVWGLGGLWVLLHMTKRFWGGRPLLRLCLPQILGLAMIVCLSASVWVSSAPALTAFKVYQMLVSFLFTQIFVEEFGARDTLKTIFLGTSLLCMAIALCAVVAPDVVWIGSEFNPDPSRLRGDLIASAGVVSTLAIILLLIGVRKIWRPVPLLLLGLFFSLLVLSLMRTAYVVTMVFLLLALLKRRPARTARQFAYVLCVCVLALYVGGSLPSLSQYRDPGNISNLDDRTGLWSYLTTTTLKHSPWFGLGYYSASRVYGLEYNPGLGTAHSMFVEVLSGGGVPSFALLIALCATLSTYALRLLCTTRDRLSFAATSLFVACLLFGFMGEEIDAGPVAMGFWYSVSVLPWLCRQSLKGRSPLGESCAPAPNVQAACTPPEIA